MSDGQELIRADKINKRFGAFWAAKNISYTLKQREVASIIGPNGAGKTTFFNLITGVYIPDEGTVSFAGQDITRVSPQNRVKLGIRRTFQLSSTFSNLTVMDNLRLAYYQKQQSGSCSVNNMLFSKLAKIKDDSIEEYINWLGFSKVVHKEVSCLSLGSKRKLELAMAIIGEPKVLLLDEPFAGLSEAEIEQIVGILKNRCVNKMAVVIIEHKITWLKGLVDRVSVLVDGQFITDGEYQEVLDCIETRRSYWKIDDYCEVEEVDGVRADA